MRHHYGGAVPKHRFLRGLLLRGLPRAWIPARAVRGGRGYFFPFPLLPSPSSCLAAF